jgi:uncharacterized protein YukE
MAFSEAQFQAAINKIESGMSDLAEKIAQIRPAAQSAVNHWYVPDVVADMVLWLADKAVNLAKTIWEKIADLLKGAAAPVRFFADAFAWEDIRGAASGISAELNPALLPVGRHWAGPAAQAYQKIIPSQAGAAARIATIADTTAVALGVCAAAGLAFYLALGIILVKFIVAMVGVIAALGSAAFSWAGLVLAVEEAGINTGLIIAAVTTLTAVLGTQAQQLVNLHGQAVDNSAFPSGRWPDPTATSYRDGSVRDGIARWSYRE